MKTLQFHWSIISVLMFCLTGTAFPQGTVFRYHGRLQANGSPANGSYDLTFSVFDADQAGNQIGSTLTNMPVNVANGVFTTALDFGAEVFTGSERWLEMGVRTNGIGSFITLTPRQSLTPTPYAIMANAASNLLGTVPASQLSGTLPSAALGGSYFGSVMFDNAANSFAGKGAGLKEVDAERLGGLGAKRFWQLAGNSGTTAGVDILGTTDDQPLEFRVKNIRALRLEPNTNGAPNIIGGAPINIVAEGVVGATISGGGTGSAIESNSISSDFGTIGGGSGNTIQTNSRWTAISGGHLNKIGAAKLGDEYGSVPTNSTIGGGYYNTIWAANSVIGGGVQNEVGSGRSYMYEKGHTIAGGSRNHIDYELMGGHSTISGGADNFVGADYGTIAGGTANRIAFSYGTVGHSIGGGRANYIHSAYDSVVGGGKSNRVTGSYSVVPGGFNNVVSADCSFAAGRRAQATHQGTFVWADSTDFDFPSINDNEFSARCAGGARFVSGIGADGTPISGVELSPGSGSWSSLSDRDAKENFAPINPREVLERVNRMPITTWNYKSQDAAIRHIGPMAQDFAAAFQVGANDRRITTVDADGVALAAIQGLNEIVQEQKTELRQKEAVIHSLQKRLEVLERAVLGRETAQSGGGQ